MEKNFIEYASYVIIDRAIPDIRDGCKPVQRRILHTLSEMHDGKLHKVANVIGETMKLHPHGDRSISDALVVLANKEYFIERQGNYGNILTGHSAAASRYIECRLTPLAVETLFDRSLTTFIPSYDGRKKEPLYLPAKVPVLLMLGTEGIAVGMSTRILPHNFIELLEAQVKILKKKEFEVFPDFFQGGMIDVSEYNEGRERIKIRAKINIVDNKKLIIKEIPFSTTTSSLISSIEAAVQKNKVSISSINDFTTDRVEIELITSRGISSEDVLPQLYAYTDCEVSIVSNILVIRNNRPVELSVSEYLREFTIQLQKQIKAELEHELVNLEDRRHWLTLEQIFIENRVYKRIEKAATEKKVRNEVFKGMEPFSQLFIRTMTDEDVRRLLELRIRRISAYDIKKNHDEIEAIALAITECLSKLKALTKTTIGYIQGLIDKYCEHFPRRTRISSFKAVDKKAVAKADIRLAYDPDTGFFGSSVKSQGFQMTVTEYERILTISSNGSYRIMAPPEKIWLPGKLLYCRVFDQEKGCNVTLVYRDRNQNAWGKKVRISKFITDKVYELCKDSLAGIEYFTTGKTTAVIKMQFVPFPRQKIKEAFYDLSKLLLCGINARGTHLHTKKVAKIKVRPVSKNKSQKTPGKKVTGKARKTGSHGKTAG
jgi:topoisomerase-4 subunit A